MITGTELTDAYLRHRGYTRIGGDGVSCILPFFILDAMYQIYRKAIAPLTLEHEPKLLRKRWIEAYNLFNRDFFAAFTLEQQDAIIDRMDDFESYIHNDVEILRVQVMNIMNRDDLETQSTISSCMACNILAQAANAVWKNTYVQRNGKPSPNRYIDTMEKMSYKLMNAIHGNSYHVDPNQNKAVCSAISVLCRKMVRWLNEELVKNN